MYVGKTPLTQNKESSTAFSQISKQIPIDYFMGHKRKESIMKENMKEQDSKHKFALYIQDSVLDIAKDLYEKDDCRSVSEFICKAIKFYGGYVTNTNMNQDYVPQVVLSTLKSIMHDSENRHNGSLFRIAVEISMIKNLLAIRHGISDVALNKLRNDCITEVKKINGTISYEDAIRWQL